MSVIAIDSSSKPKATRLSFGEALVEIGARDASVVVCDADLSKSTRTDLFAAQYPDRFFNFGIAEANMIGSAAGLARGGKTVFAASFGCFLTGRFDQIRMSVSFSGTKVRLVGTHAGVGIGEDGHSQMALEDLALMRSLPNMVVFQPADDFDTRQFLNWSLGFDGPCYLRLTRQNLVPLKRAADFRFEESRWAVAGSSQGLTEAVDLRKYSLPGDAVVVCASGALVGPTLQALEQETSFPWVVVNSNWIQPYDVVGLDHVLAARPRKLVSVEDHYRWGGLGTLIAEHMADRGSSCSLLRLGVSSFGQSGTPEDNYRHYGFTPGAIRERIVQSLAF
jgi:transketolase